MDGGEISIWQLSGFFNHQSVTRTLQVRLSSSSCASR
jgi:hypothetical protein